MNFSKKDKISILTGAGISAASGIKTFRGNDGLWENHRIEEVASPQGFRKNPKFVWNFYKARYKQLRQVRPNPAHFALKKLEDYSGENFFLITQNIDGLHYSAGNKNVIEMHGALRECFCSECGFQTTMDKINLIQAIPECEECEGVLRPNVVWFGEIPYFMKKIENILVNSDYFIIIGTSGVVYPAAGFLRIAKYNGASTIGINLENPQNLSLIDEFHQGKAGELLPELVEEWTSEG